MPQDENIRTPRELAAAIIRQTAGEESVRSAIQGRFQSEEELQRLLEDYLYLRQNTFRRLKREASLEAFKNVVRDSLVLAGRDIRIGDDYHIRLDDPAEKRLQNLKIDLLRREIHNYRNFQFPDQTHDYIQLPMQARIAEVRPFSKVEQRRAGPQDVTHMPIQEVFNHFNGEMLILGSPGAGKTTLLYELANSLAAEAKYGMIEQTPVLLNLSSWGSRKEDLPSIFSWVVEELIEAGGKKQWNRLIEGGHLIFLFDGLDEVPENKRVACMQAINAFSRDYRARTAICCRRAEYDLIRKSSDGQALRLEGAIEIMPIEEEQAMAYFHKHELQRVAEAFSRSETLRELLRTPLWLYLATRTYSSEKWELLPEGADGWNNVLMGFYEDWLLDEKRPQENQKRASGYAEEDVVQWTAWLAFVLDREKQTVFRLERMQYYFLPKRLIPAYAFYAHLAFGLAFGLAGGLAFGLAFGLAVGLAGGLAGGLRVLIAQNSYTLKETTMPNEGIYRSGKYALWGLAPGCFVLSSLFWIPGDYLTLEFNGLELSLVIAVLGAALLVSIPEQLGAQGYIRHYLIRHLLYKENFIPRRYVRFLEYCCRLGYLRRVGGGYSFFHQEFRKYLVEDYKKRFRRQYGSRALERR